MSLDGIKAKLQAVEREIDSNDEKTKKQREEENKIRDEIADRTKELRIAEGKRQALEDAGTKLIKRKHEVETELQREEQRK